MKLWPLSRPLGSSRSKSRGCNDRFKTDQCQREEAIIVVGSRQKQDYV